MWCAETELSIKPLLIVIVLALFSLLITNAVASWQINLLRNEQGFT